MRRAARISTTRAERTIPVEIEATVDAVAVAGESHRGTTALLEMIAAESVSHFQVPIKATAMVMANGIHTTRSSMALMIEAHIPRRPTSITLKKTGASDK